MVSISSSLTSFAMGLNNPLPSAGIAPLVPLLVTAVNVFTYNVETIHLISMRLTFQVLQELASPQMQFFNI